MSNRKPLPIDEDDYYDSDWDLESLVLELCRRISVLQSENRQFRREINELSLGIDYDE